MTLRPPWRRGRSLPTVSVNVVLVREPRPPKNEPPVEWMLLTSLPIQTVEEVRQVIESYCVRWMIEVFFRTLKSGCRIESAAVRTDRSSSALLGGLPDRGVANPVCVPLGPHCPEVSCEALFEPAEWKSVYQVANNRPPPRKPPSLGQLVRMIAALGGYVSRSRSSCPGPQTVWTGLQRMHDFALAWESFGPGAKRRS